MSLAINELYYAKTYLKVLKQLFPEGFYLGRRQAVGSILLARSLDLFVGQALI
jgi:hypothetical protein